MKRIGILSDTHGYLDPKIFDHFKDVDEIWHAGDVGDIHVIEQLRKFKPVIRGVYGNIDDQSVRLEFPEFQSFTVENIKVLMTHIAGKPGKYVERAHDAIKKEKPKLFICGHSHILKVQYDKKLNILHLNPGAAGKYGFHTIRTMLRFELDKGEIKNLEIIELATKT
mgnify:CR=1 FL=1